MKTTKEFLLNQAIRIANNITVVSPIPCNIIMLDNADEKDGFYDRGFCKVCKEYRMESLCNADCRRMMSESCIQSEQWGGKYESLCPLCLAFISTMIYDRNSRIGLYMGPFLMISMTDLQDDVLRFFPEDKADIICEELGKCKFIKPDEVSAYSDLLFMLASYGIKRNSMDTLMLEQISINSKQQFDMIRELKEQTESTYSVDIEKKLLSHLAQRDTRAMQVDVNEIVSRAIVTSGSNIQIIKGRLYELVVLFSREVIDSGADTENVFIVSEQMTSQLRDKKTVQDLYPWISELILTYSNLISSIRDVNRPVMINEIVTYLRLNYMKKISLDDVALHMGLSPSYVSRTFKKEMGCGIPSYLNQIRVENAKILLLEKNHSLAEIAYICGFEDQTYFSKIFKRYAGISPGKYREKRGRYYISKNE